MTTQNTIESKVLESFKIGDVVSTTIDIYQYSYEGGVSKGYCKGNPFTVAEVYINEDGTQYVAASDEHQFVSVKHIEKSL
jgi:hypothetical protein